MALGVDVDAGGCLGGDASDPSRGLRRCVFPRRREGGDILGHWWFDLARLLVRAKALDGELLPGQLSVNLDEQVERESIALQGGRLDFAARGISEVLFDSRRDQAHACRRHTASG